MKEIGLNRIVHMFTSPFHPQLPPLLCAFTSVHTPFHYCSQRIILKQLHVFFLKTIFLCSDVRYPQRLMITSVSIKMLMIRIPLIKNTTVTLHPGRSWSFGFPGYLPHKFWSKFRELQLHEQFRTDVNNLFFSCRLVT